ncbi:unnamed protein product, partial [Polarella glacialis]
MFLARRFSIPSIFSSAANSQKKDSEFDEEATSKAGKAKDEQDDSNTSVGDASTFSLASSEESSCASDSDSDSDALLASVSPKSSQAGFRRVRKPESNAGALDSDSDLSSSERLASDWESGNLLSSSFAAVRATQ